jgi:hypothetical protein
MLRKVSITTATFTCLVGLQAYLLRNDRELSLFSTGALTLNPYLRQKAKQLSLVPISMAEGATNDHLPVITDHSNDPTYLKLQSDVLKDGYVKVTDDVFDKIGKMFKHKQQNHRNALHETLASDNMVGKYEIYRKESDSTLKIIVRLGTHLNGYPGRDS